MKIVRQSLLGVATFSSCNPILLTLADALPALPRRIAPQFFDIFDLETVRGHVSTEPHTAIVTESAANRLFNTSDPIGKIVTRPGEGHDDVGDYRITGVIERSPQVCIPQAGCGDFVAHYLPKGRRPANVGGMV